MELAPWKRVSSTVAAVFLAILFAVSGGWKLADPFQWSQALTEFRVPSDLSLPFTVALGIGEMLGAVLILIPRFRRWGGLLIAFLLLAFMVYIGANYSTLAGKECSCFPLVKRTIGPPFFVADFAMLALALLAAGWAPPSGNLRRALVILGAIVLFAGVSFGVNSARVTGLKAPDTVIVDGKPYSLQQGDIFLFFYDPECMHCDAAAKRMSKLNWKTTKVVAIPTHDPQFAEAFLHDTGLHAITSLDIQQLRAIFKFVDPPYGVALQRGRQKVAIASWDDSEPAVTLRKIGFVE